MPVSELAMEETYSNHFGERNAMVVSVKNGRSAMDFVVKKGHHCSVSLSDGATIEDMKELTLAFIEAYQPVTLVNQVSHEKELRAMYKAGFRMPSEGKKPLHLKATLDALAQNPSILMAWKGLTPW